jgi:PB1 domain-containing protein
MNSVSAAKDDRSQDDISYAASNLVKTDIKSRYRQQSEPPPNRDVFPPTPPPDNDRVSGASSSNSGTIVAGSRGESGRGGQKLRPLDLTTAGFSGTNGRPELNRTMSERSGGERSTADRNRGQSNRPGNGGGSRSERRPSQGSTGGFGQQEYDEVYDMYGRQPPPAPTGGRPRAPTTSKSNPGYISEEDDEAVNSFDEPDFEMISARSSGRKRRSVPDVKKIRVKVHADDTRYVMVGVAVEFRDFVDQIRIKFGIRQSFKVKIKDDGDMITMSDQDDLDMAIAQSKSDAKKEKNEMGKMEVSFHGNNTLLES